ncbi:DoxX family protein [Chitinophaga sedimenti]|uniref:DoxX family protein n=1 Tax=Chitinophaga sedimenti TaxID=2033606 RepID=UPI002002B949|nr:DoxX family protein [Chitinophaga sedimenti]MCK7560025.1 DoxX family protein [Chitinophaga sedimenti]
MMELIKTLLHSDLGNNANNWAMLVFRVLLAVELFRVHGLKKFKGEKEVVPNPLGLPPALNQLMATFADTVVPLFVILGLGTRLVVWPTIGVTAVGYFVVHRNDPVEVRDVPYVYTLCFLLVAVLGPGARSFDEYFSIY